MTQPIFTLRRNAVAIALAISAISLNTNAASSAALNTPTAHFELPADELARSLTRLAQQAGIAIAFTPGQTQGHRAPALRGQLSTEQALTILLQKSGLEAIRGEDGSYTLRENILSILPIVEVIAIKPLARVASVGDVTLPAVEVSAEPTTETATSPVQGFVARRSSTATKTDTPLVEIPQSISVLGREELESRGSTTLVEALRTTPGVFNHWGTDIRGVDWLMLRGFNATNTHYRDGLFQTAFSNIDPITEMYGLERVEVLRGPSSMMFGQGDAGGIVNRVSKMPHAGAVNEVDVQYGTYNRKQVAADLNGQLNDDGTLRYRLVGVGLDSESADQYTNGYRIEQQRLYLAPSLRWQPSVDTSLTVLSEFYKNTAGDDLGYQSGINGEDSNTKEGEPGYSELRQKSASLGYMFEHRFNEQWQVKQNLRYSQRSADKDHLWSNLDTSTAILERTVKFHGDELSQIAVDNQVHGDFATGTVQHKVLAGLDFNRSHGDEIGRADAAPSLDFYNPVYGQAITPPQTVVDDYSETMQQLGVYAQDQIKFTPNWLLTVGGRYDWVKKEVDDRLNQSQTEEKDGALTGRLGLTYLFDNGWAPYASYATSFLPQGGRDVNKKAFDPSEGAQVEVGVKYAPVGSPYSFAAAVYDLRKSNVLTQDPINEDYQVQTGEIRSRGLELEARGEIYSGLNIVGTYTFIDADVLQSNDGNQGKTPIQIPKQNASVWLDYALPSVAGLRLAGGVRYVGERWNDAANTSKEAGYTLADLAIIYDKADWRFALNVNNLFDKKYYTTRAYGSYYRGEELTALGSVKYRF